MNKTKILRILIPLVAVMVIIESIYLVTTLVNRKNTGVGPGVVVEDEGGVNIALVSQTENYAVGEAFEVKVVMNAKKDLLADAVNLYIGYDAAMAEVSELTSGEAMPEPTFAKISDKKDMIVLNYYIDREGMPFVAGQEMEIASFMVTPLKEGEIKMDLSTGIDDQDSVTMIVENGTSRVVPFEVNNLSIQIGL